MSIPSQPPIGNVTPYFRGLVPLDRFEKSSFGSRVIIKNLTWGKVRVRIRLRVRVRVRVRGVWVWVRVNKRAN